MSTNEELIGRGEVDDLEAILSVVNTDVDEALHAVRDNAESIFTWDYEKGARPALNKLYEKAKGAQWNGETDLPWDTPVDPYEVVVNNFVSQGQSGVAEFDVAGTPFEKWSDEQWLEHIRRTLTTVHHPGSTCRMGPAGDNVVDHELRVHGLEQLRVADASIYPRLVGANTNASVVAIAEKASDLILGKPAPTPIGRSD